jgi:hypothetical protein
VMDGVPSMTGDPWGALGITRYGTEPIRPDDTLRVSIPHVQAGAGQSVPPWSPQHPLFWFGALLLATGAGLFAVSGSVRVAKTNASASVGKS